MSKHSLFRWSAIRKAGFEGPDASLAECIIEYGVVWRQFKRKTGSYNKGDWQMLFRTGGQPEGEKYDPCAGWTWGWLKADLDWRKEWTFINDGMAEDFLRYLGATDEDFRKHPVPEQAWNLAQYYGWDNIMGTNYHPIYLKGVPK
jgi:hypothetical protein